MSIQDDIFDVEDTLNKLPKNKADLAAFDRLVRWAGAMEAENEELREENVTLRGAIKIVNNCTGAVPPEIIGRKEA